MDPKRMSKGLYRSGINIWILIRGGSTKRNVQLKYKTNTTFYILVSDYKEQMSEQKENYCTRIFPPQNIG